MVGGHELTANEDDGGEPTHDKQPPSDDRRLRSKSWVRRGPRAVVLPAHTCGTTGSRPRDGLLFACARWLPAATGSRRERSNNRQRGQGGETRGRNRLPSGVVEQVLVGVDDDMLSSTVPLRYEGLRNRQGGASVGSRSRRTSQSSLGRSIRSKSPLVRTHTGPPTASLRRADRTALRRSWLPDITPLPTVHWLDADVEPEDMSRPTVSAAISDSVEDADEKSPASAA